MIPGGKHRGIPRRRQAQATEPAPPPEYMYSTTQDGTVIRSKVLGFHPQFGFPMTSKVWETAPEQPTE